MTPNTVTIKGLDRQATKLLAELAGAMGAETDINLLAAPLKNTDVPYIYRGGPHDDSHLGRIFRYLHRVQLSQEQAFNIVRLVKMRLHESQTMPVKLNQPEAFGDVVPFCTEADKERMEQRQEIRDDEYQEDGPDIIYPKKPRLQGEGTIVEFRSHLVFDSATARDYSFWLNALDYCMAVAREFEKKEWSRRNPEAIPNYSLGSGWKSGLVLGGTPQLFRFCTLKDCDLFIRSVGQGRLNLIFGVKS